MNYKITALATFFMLADSAHLSAQRSPFQEHLSDYIENLAVFETNQEPGRAYFIPAKHLMLNGKWRFRWSDTPDNAPKGFFRTDFKDSSWGCIEVPSNWEMEGYGDKMFRNVSAPFHVDVPRVPHDYNPTGTYRRTFEIPQNWNDAQIFLRMEKVASASFVWINGKEVGYNEGAQEPAEFNITPYLKKGQNLIAIQVMKYSDGFYLEGQDYWRLAGIFDDILVYAAPPTRLFDWHITTDLDDQYRNATLNVEATVKQYETMLDRKCTLKAQLCSTDGHIIEDLPAKDMTITGKGECKVNLSAYVKAPKLWTAEAPNMYLVKMQLTDDRGNIIDQAENRIGFKETKIIGSVFYLNGVAIKLKATNSHMQHPLWGHTMKEEVIRKDFELLKQFNFNAVRTSHYPPVNKYLQLANEYGMYIIDETGDESHATEWVSDKPEFTEMYRDRVRQMVLRDRNYPCVLFWSAGNESGEGSNITEVVKEGRKYDATRYWMYGGNAFAHPAEDIIGPRYPSPMEEEIQVGMCPDKNDIRPSFMDEYLSVAGNGCGALDDYWRVIYSHPRIIGGAIWDFVSPGLQERVRRVDDLSPNDTPTYLMGNAKIEKDSRGNVLHLDGHDEWVEVYRQNNTEINGNQLTLTMDVCPGSLTDDGGTFLTKGDNQFGLHQNGPKQLEFYIYTDKRYQIDGPLPEDWKHHWHNITAIYDGKQMKLFIDKRQIATGDANGNIRNLPFPVNIGRNAESQRCETNVAICDAKIDNVGIFSTAIDNFDFHAKDAALWLDFEKENDLGTFFSYGIGARTYGSIWPDRRPQPEMWQMKKTQQPVDYRWVDDHNFIIEMWNHNCFTSTDQYSTCWMLKQDTTTIQSGEITDVVKPLERRQIKLPISIPDIKPNAEYRVEIVSRLKSNEMWSPKGHVMAWEQLDLPWRKIDAMPRRESGSLTVVENDTAVSVSGKDFTYRFSKTDGTLASMVYHGKELLVQAPRMNVWRAPLANEQDDWTIWSEDRHNWKQEYGRNTATEQYSYGMDDLVNMPVAFDVQKSDQEVNVNIRSYMLTRDKSVVKKDKYISGVQTNGFENIYAYRISPDGIIRLSHSVLPSGNLPKWLFRMGLTMTLAKDLHRVKWYGRGPQENYPDRKSGYPIGIYAMSTEEMYEPYLLPEDYGLRTDNRWVELTDDRGIGVKFSVNQPFNFNVYPFTTDNLTKAAYTYELQQGNGLTFNLDYATSGVGCTARSIFASYKTPVMRFDREIVISPISR